MALEQESKVSDKSNIAERPAPAARKRISPAAAAENEACAALIEKWTPGHRHSLRDGDLWRLRRAMAADIRARGGAA